MKLIFFSDIHGNLGAFQAFQRRCEQEHPDLVVFCGDVFGYYYQQERILTSLRESGWLCLLGNHDRYFLDLLDGSRDVESLIQAYGTTYARCLGTGAVSEKNLAFLRTWKPQAQIDADGLKIAAFHGSPSDPINGRVYPDTPIADAELYAPYDFVILGHTHHKMTRAVGGATVFNPGSLGQQRDGRGCSYMTFDTCTRSASFQLVEYNISPLLREIEANDPDKPFLASVLVRGPRKEGQA